MKQLIQSVYKAFEKYERPYDFGACECCMTHAERSELLNVQLKDVDPEKLDRYANMVFLTMGEIEDFKYFLPRILELTVKNELSLTEVVLGKLASANWTMARTRA
jgi:hypothetical protein